MRFTLLSAALLASALGTSACYVSVDDGPGPRTGDLTLRYSFDGLDCDRAGVARIAINIDGDTRGDRYNDSLSCSQFRDGVTIENLIEDNYTVTIEGRASNGEVLYALDNKSIGIVAFTHQEYDFDVPSQSGALTIYWTFLGSGSCGAVTDVRVRLIDPAGFVFDDSRYPCDYEGVTYDVVSAGVWSVSIDGINANNRVVYQANNQRLDVIVGANNTYTVDLGETR